MCQKCHSVVDGEPLRFRGEVYHPYHFNCTGIYIYTYSCNLCLFVWMPDHNSGTPWQICLKLEVGTPKGMCLIWFWDSKLSGSTCVGKKKSKIVIYDQARVNGGSNYAYPGLIHYITIHRVSIKKGFNRFSLFWTL